MAMYTNVSQRLIHAPDGTMMIPGQPVEVAGECSDNAGFQDLVDSGDIKAGEVAPEELEKVRQERQDARQEQADMTRQEQEHRSQPAQTQHAQHAQHPPQQQQPQPQPRPTPTR